MDTSLLDLRFAARAMRRNLGLSVVAILTLAIGIGASTAVFSVVDRLLFGPLPYPDAGRIVTLGMTAPIERNAFLISYDYVEWRKASVFSSAAAWTGVSDCDLTDRNPVRLACASVEATFLPTFGIQPLLGRNFEPEENRPNAPRVALLSYGFWRSRFGSDPSVVGSTFSLDTRPTRIIGILPPSFELPNMAPTQVLVPMTFSDAELASTHTTARIVRAFALLKPGVTLAQAHAALHPFFDQSMQWVPPQFRHEVQLAVTPLRDWQVRDSRVAAWVLFGSVLAVLLIACANIANLLLARAAARTRELAVRAALGAGRWRLVRQALTESTLLALLAASAGCGLAFILLRVFIAMAPEGIPRLQQAAVDVRVLVFCLGVALFSGLLSGFAPALHRTSPELLTGRTLAQPGSAWFRHLLVAAQIAISLALLASASLLLRSLWNLQADPLGVQTSGVVTVNMDLGQRYSQPAQRMAFYEHLQQRAQRLPGVLQVAFSDSLPPGGRMRTTLYSAILVRGRPRYLENTGGMVAWRMVTPQYFSALQIPITAGRGFDEEDRNPAANAIILSQSLARKMFPGADPIGQQLQPGLQGPWHTVVGVAADVKNGGLGAPSDPEYYVAWRQVPSDAPPRASLIIRTDLSPAAIAQWLRGEIAALDPLLPVDIETMQQHVGSFVQRPRFNAALVSFFAAIGLLLAAIGVYGVVSFLVVQRTQEIGVRMALGATPLRVLRLVTWQALRPVIAGALIGIAASLATSRLLASLLFHVQPRDPFTYAAAALLLIAVGGLAGALPARRAARVDPMIALRHE